MLLKKGQSITPAMKLVLVIILCVVLFFILMIGFSSRIEGVLISDYI